MECTAINQRLVGAVRENPWEIRTRLRITRGGTREKLPKISIVDLFNKKRNNAIFIVERASSLFVLFLPVLSLILLVFPV